MKNIYNCSNYYITTGILLEFENDCFRLGTFQFLRYQPSHTIQHNRVWLTDYLCKENWLDALFILSSFRQLTSTRFGDIFSPSSGGILYIYNNWYVLFIYSRPPDDGLQICPKHVDADWRNKMRINTASSWFSLHGYIEMHGQQNIKLTDYWERRKINNSNNYYYSLLIHVLTQEASGHLHKDCRTVRRQQQQKQKQQQKHTKTRESYDKRGEIIIIIIIMGLNFL
jgi:hypothetical protein